MKIKEKKGEKKMKKRKERTQETSFYLKNNFLNLILPELLLVAVFTV